MQSQTMMVDAWLMRGIQSTKGQLLLKDATIGFTCLGAGQLFRFQLNKLERQLGQQGLAERLNRGKQVQLFNQPIMSCDFRWPWHAFSAGFVVTVNGLKFRLYFSPPGSDRRGVDSLSEAVSGRQTGRRWRIEIERLKQCVDEG